MSRSASCEGIGGLPATPCVRCGNHHVGACHPSPEHQRSASWTEDDIRPLLDARDRLADFARLIRDTAHDGSVMQRKAKEALADVEAIELAAIPQIEDISDLIESPTMFDRDYLSDPPPASVFEPLLDRVQHDIERLRPDERTVLARWLVRQ